MAEGKTAAEAGEEYVVQRNVIRHSLYVVYRELLERKSDASTVYERLLAGLKDADSLDLVDWDRATNLQGSVLSFHWKGWPVAEFISLDREPQRPRFEMPGERTKQLYATELYEVLGRVEGKCWHIIAHGGD